MFEHIKRENYNPIITDECIQEFLNLFVLNPEKIEKEKREILREEFYKSEVDRLIVKEIDEILFSYDDKAHFYEENVAVINELNDIYANKKLIQSKFELDCLKSRALFHPKCYKYNKEALEKYPDYDERDYYLY